MNKSVTERGFDIITFEDAYGEECSLQESSSIVPHVWLGISKVKPSIMASNTPQGGEGWVEYPIPDNVQLNGRMHLNIKQIKELIVELQSFVDEHEDAGGARNA